MYVLVSLLKAIIKGHGGGEEQVQDEGTGNVAAISASTENETREEVCGLSLSVGYD